MEKVMQTEVTVDPQKVLDSLAAHIAILDQNGTIVQVNRAWNYCFSRRLKGLSCVGSEDPPSDADAPPPPSASIGANYLSVCRNTQGREAPYARDVLAGLEDVLAGRQAEFNYVYRCAWPVEVLEFLLTATRLPGGGAVVSHQEIPPGMNRAGAKVAEPARSA
jgi:hypothetical protein